MVAARWCVASGVAYAGLAGNGCSSYDDNDGWDADQLTGDSLGDVALDEQGLEGDMMDALGTATAELRATGAPTIVNDCTGADRVTVQAAFDLIRTRLWDPVGSAEFLGCLRQSVFSSTYAYPEFLLSLLREDVQTTLGCDNANANSPPEVISIGAALRVSDPKLTSTQIVADVMIHELAHTKGRLVLPTGTGHPGPHGCVDCAEHQLSVTNQVSSCLFDTVPMDGNYSVPLPHFFPSRGVMASATGESVLAPVGVSIDKLRPAQNNCTTDERGSGLSGRAGSLVDSVGMVCRGTGADRLNTPTGGTGGTAFDFRCPSNELLVGVRGRARSTVNAIGPICALTSAISIGSSLSNVDPPIFGGTGGNAFVRRCPSRHILKGMRVRQNGTVQRIDITCQRIDRLRNITTTGLEVMGGDGGTILDDEACPSMSVMDKLWAVNEQLNNTIGRLGASCTRVSNTVAGGEITVTEGANDIHHMLPFHGSDVPEDTGLAVTAQCTDVDSVLVGLTTWSHQFQGRPNGIAAAQGKCASTARGWSNGSSTATTNTTRIGSIPAGAPAQTVLCPARSFLTGWRTVERLGLASIQPVCRAF